MSEQGSWFTCFLDWLFRRETPANGIHKALEKHATECQEIRERQFRQLINGYRQSWERDDTTRVRTMLVSHAQECAKPSRQQVLQIIEESRSAEDDRNEGLRFLEAFFRYQTEFALRDADRSSQAFGVSGVAVTVVALVGVTLLVRVTGSTAGDAISGATRHWISISLSLGAVLFFIAVAGMIFDYASLFAARRKGEPKTLRAKSIAYKAEHCGEKAARALISNVTEQKESIVREYEALIIATSIRMWRRHKLLTRILLCLACSLLAFVVAIVTFVDAALYPPGKDQSVSILIWGLAGVAGLIMGILGVMAWRELRHAPEPSSD